MQCKYIISLAENAVGKVSLCHNMQYSKVEKDPLLLVHGKYNITRDSQVSFGIGLNGHIATFLLFAMQQQKHPLMQGNRRLATKQSTPYKQDQSNASPAHMWPDLGIEAKQHGAWDCQCSGGWAAPSGTVYLCQGGASYLRL